MNHFDLMVEAEPDAGVVRLRLLGQHGSCLASAQVTLADHSFAGWQGVFDTPSYVKRYAGQMLRPDDTKPVTASQLLEEIGRFLGKQVLGPDITAALQGKQRRTLVVHLPAPGEGALAAALARVPWEIARTAAYPTPLIEQNLVIRQVLQGLPMPAAEGPAAGPLRVLLVFAEAPGSRPLAMRLEREQLLDLFFDDILPRHNVKVDVLCHGVTRSRLEEQIRSHGGTMSYTGAATAMTICWSCTRRKASSRTSPASSS